MATDAISQQEQKIDPGDPPAEKLAQALACNPALDLHRVRDNLARIRQRGYDRGEDLEAKLVTLLSQKKQ